MQLYFLTAKEKSNCDLSLFNYVPNFCDQTAGAHKTTARLTTDDFSMLTLLGKNV